MDVGEHAPELSEEEIVCELPAITRTYSPGATPRKGLSDISVPVFLKEEPPEELPEMRLPEKKKLKSWREVAKKRYADRKLEEQGLTRFEDSTSPAGRVPMDFRVC